MSSIFQDTTFGNTLNWLSKGKLLPYPEQKSSFVVPDRYKIGYSSAQAPAEKLQVPQPAHAARSASLESDSSASTRCPSPCPQAEAEARHASRSDSDNTTLNDVNIDDPQDAHFKRDVEKATHLSKSSSSEKQDPNLVDWYGQDDPENPQNWSKAKKYTLLASVMLLTFAVYIGSAIYTPSVPGVMEEFGVSQTKALLGLSLYVLAYGIGPMLFSPLSEIPSIGRLNVYMVTLLIFVLLQIPTALAPNYDTLMSMRFIAGLVCSPALATGGATLADVFSPEVIPYATALWSAGAVAGPTLGPVAGGYAAQEENWRWPLYMLLFLSLAALIVLFFFFAETSKATILLRRAQRLRKLTGNDKLRSQSEIDQSKMSGSQIVSTALLTPFRLLLEPIAFAIDLYIGLIYAVFYLWFESFPLVFGGIYGFGLGAQGLPFIGFIVALLPTLIVYFAYQRYKVIPEWKKTGTIVPESRLVVALVGAAIIPAALVLFGWLSRESVHWMGPVIAASLYLPGIYLVFQGGIVYLPMSYPNVAASVLAGNALVRGIVAAVFPLFGHSLFVNLGIGPASSLLAGLSLVLIVPMWALWKYGHRLRAHSKFASA